MPDKPDRGKWIKLALKILVTALCIWYISGKIDFRRAGSALREANWIYLLLALNAFIASKIISAIRLNIYFSNIGINLPPATSYRLYWLGMFYNLFLPGSIGGDAYKVVVLTKTYGVPYKKTSAAVLLDRFSGLLGLGILLAVYSFFVLPVTWQPLLISAAAVIAIIALYLVIRYYLPDFRPSFLRALLLGIAVQGCQVVCAYLIMAALHIPAHVTEYIFVFLVSSVVSVLPLTVGGFGIRELVFFEGAAYFGLVKEVSVVIGVLFYLVTLVTSAWGAIYVFNDPLKRKKDSN